MSLVIRNGHVVTASDSYHADILCEDETITRIGPNLPAPPGATIIDAAGQYVFPGFIDPHVHIYLPFMGTVSKDTYETSGGGGPGYGYNPGCMRGTRIGSVKDGKVTAFIPDPAPTAGTSAAEGVAADHEGNVYGAEVGPKDLKKYVKKP